MIYNSLENYFFVIFIVNLPETTVMKPPDKYDLTLCYFTRGRTNIVPITDSDTVTTPGKVTWYKDAPHLKLADNIIKRCMYSSHYETYSI